MSVDLVTRVAREARDWRRMSVHDRGARSLWEQQVLMLTLMCEKRLPMVPDDSSAARMPLPGAAMAAAVALSSSAYLLISGLRGVGRK